MSNRCFGWTCQFDLEGIVGQAGQQSLRGQCAESSPDQDQESDLQPEGRASGFVQTSGLEDSCWYALDRSLDLFDGVENGGMQCVQHIALIDDRRSASNGHGFFVFGMDRLRSMQ